MRKLPEKLLQSLEGVAGFDRDAFVKVHQDGAQVTSIRINPNKPANVFPGQLTNIPWTQFGFYLEKRPSFTFDPLFHAGTYYVQEASSMFLEQAFRQLADLSRPLKVVDLCAAPGGKSTHIQSLLSKESLLVSNEVIKNRNHVLIDNLVKWGTENAIVTINDPSAFSKLKGYFDVMVVDAPCSGSGLFRREEEAIDQWGVNNVQLCCQRQQRILADALPSLKENGLLVYSTCSYSAEEDEDIMDWLVKEMKLENVALEIEPAWNIVKTISSTTSLTGYRFYPDKLKGEGFFMACFRKKDGEDATKFRQAKPEKASAKEKAIISPWFRQSYEIVKERDSFFALPFSLMDDYVFLKNVLNIQHAGIGLGQLMKDKLIPAHSLALSSNVSKEIPFIDLDEDTAIKYLQRQEIRIDTKEKGWQLVCYEGQNLGWVNVLPNRINNYYPKELRILKQQR